MTEETKDDKVIVDYEKYHKLKDELKDKDETIQKLQEQIDELLSLDKFGGKVILQTKVIKENINESFIKTLIIYLGLHDNDYNRTVAWEILQRDKCRTTRESIQKSYLRFDSELNDEYLKTKEEALKDKYSQLENIKNNEVNDLRKQNIDLELDIKNIKRRHDNEFQETNKNLDVLLLRLTKIDVELEEYNKKGRIHRFLHSYDWKEKK